MALTFVWSIYAMHQWLSLELEFFLDSGADPGFLEGGFKSTKGGSFPRIYLIFHKFSHKIERICLQRGVQANPPNPL